jgi:hypothetical protein
MTPSTPQPKTRGKRPVEDDGQGLVRAILNLPTRLRDVFLLHRMVGMSYPEIGLHLGMTPEAVQASLAAALVRLTRAVRTSEPSSKDLPETSLVSRPGQPAVRHFGLTRLRRVFFLRNSGQKIPPDQV